LVLQAALFAGFLSAFLIELLNRLEQDPMDVIQEVMIHQTQMMRNSSLEPYVLPDFSPPEYIVVVNALFYASLGIMLLAAFIAMIIRGWVRELDRRLEMMSIPEQRAKTREFRHLGMKRWKLPEMIATLPLLIHLSLLLFSIGLGLFLFHISNPSFIISTVILGVGILYYTITTSISVFITSSPFHSPLSRAWGAAYRHVLTYFCQDIHYFLSPRMDTTPASALDRLLRGVQIFLQKLRPYREKDFVDPIGATTVDEVQLSTATSALQRIHDIAPNSRLSEPLQSSVWRVAGSPTLRITPMFRLPSWVFGRRDDQGHLPLDKVATLMAISSHPYTKKLPKNPPKNPPITVHSYLRPRKLSESPWDRLVYGVFHVVLKSDPKYRRTVEAKPDDLISMLKGKELHEEEAIWLLNRLSDLRSHILVSTEEPSFIDVCLEILLWQAPKWTHPDAVNIVLLEAVVAFAAISSSGKSSYRQKILNSSRKYPWLLLNLRNPELIRKLAEGTLDRRPKHSILFLVLYALMWRRSEDFAAQYFSIITEKDDFPLYTSALTAIAPVIKDVGLSAITRMLVAPRGQSLVSMIKDSIEREDCYVQKELLQHYDLRLEASENPDPNIVAILLLLSKQLPSSEVDQLHDLDLELKNPWLKRAARVIARRDIPDASSTVTGPFHDHKVHNMIAALSLRRYVDPRPIQHPEYELLASFLGSREPAVSALGLGYYMQTILSDYDPPPPPLGFKRALCAVFNLILPGHQLHMGWKMLDMFVKGFDTLPTEWRQTFADAFFTLSRQPLKKLCDDRDISTAESELEKILTWEYFHEKERASEFTDFRYSGLDWMVVAWLLHLSQQSGTMMGGSTTGEARPQSWGTPMIDERFVLGALCKLLDTAFDADPSAPQVAPNIPKLREFIQWFGHSQYRSRIEARIP